jgi:acyl-coenzyme A synthetase/AMP-(fatty) acid ligase
MVYISAKPCYNNSGLFTAEQCLFSEVPLVLLQKFKADVFLKAIHDHSVTSVTALPTMINLINKKTNLCADLDLSRVVNVTLSGEPVNQSILNIVKKLFPNAQLHVGYGSTEGGSAMFGAHPSLPVPELSVGYPLPEILYRIVNGILQVKSPYMMKQYTVESDVFTKDGYYITNDLFEIDENGFYYCQGRADEIFKSGGNKISPAEIEQILLGHADVNQVSIVAVADEIKGLKPYAFAVIEKNSKVTEQELIKYCSQHLTPYQIPRRIWLVDQIPVNSTGKIDRARLKIQAQQLVQT